MHPNPIPSVKLSFTFTERGTPAAMIGPRNLLVEGNRFVDCPRPEIQFTWTRNAVVRDNLAERPSGQVLPAAVSTSNSENIRVEDSP